MRNVGRRRAVLIKKDGPSACHYYNFYADNDWGAADADVAINSGKLGVEKSIEVLAGICEHL